jgi:predicted peptidase
MRGACGAWSERQRSHGLYYYIYSPTVRDAPLLSNGSTPLLLWLHGGTWTTQSNLSAAELSEAPWAELLERHACFLLRPLARRRHSWVSPHLGPKAGSHRLRARAPPSLALASGMLDRVLSLRPRVDRSRVVLAGASMGGYGAWQLAQRRPGLFEAIVPISGGGDPSAAGALNGTRVWAVAGRKDAVVLPNASRQMFAALLAVRGIAPGSPRVRRRRRDAGSDDEAVEVSVHPLPGELWREVRYTEYVHAGHDVWMRAIRDARLTRWALGSRHERGCTPGN